MAKNSPKRISPKRKTSPKMVVSPMTGGRTAGSAGRKLGAVSKVGKVAGSCHKGKDGKAVRCRNQWVQNFKTERAKLWKKTLKKELNDAKKKRGIKRN